MYFGNSVWRFGIPLALVPVDVRLLSFKMHRGHQSVFSYVRFFSGKRFAQPTHVKAMATQLP